MKIKHKFSILLLFIIILVGAYFRFVNFPHNPPSLNYDEVSIGYNAYSINETGKDEFGSKYPLYFRSLDDYKQPVYIYMVAATQNIFGVNDFSVRLPSALFGTLTIILIYFLTLTLFRKRSIALTSSFIFAILPWSVQFSRYALEANVALFFLLLGIFAFLKGIKHKKNWLIPISVVSFTVASYTYLSYKVVIPLIILTLLILYFKKINFKDKFVIVAIIIALFSFALTLNDSLSSQGQTRFQGTSILYDKDTFENELEEAKYEGELGINLPRRIFHETPHLINAKLITKGYLKHFSTDFLFFNQGNRHNFTPNIGLLYLWMLPFIIFGAYFAFRKYDRRATFLVFALVLIAPIPAAVTYDAPHAIRVFLISVPFTILASIGVIEFYHVLKKYKLIQISFILFLAVFIFFSTWQFFRQHQIHSPWQRSQEWQYGQEEMVNYIMENQNKYDEIIVSPNNEWPHIFVLYYSKYDPKKYLASGGTKSGTFDSEDNTLENISFKKFSIPQDLETDKKILLIGTPNDFPQSINPNETIYYLDDTPAIYMVHNLSQ